MQAVRSITIAFSSCFLLASTAAAGELVVMAVDPPIHALTVEPNASIAIDFDRALTASALPPATDDLYVFGSNSGVAAGVWSLENGAARARFTPLRPFLAGEQVIVGLSNQLQAQDGSLLRPAGYVWRFRIKAEPAPMSFTQIDSMTSQSIPNVTSRIYGANGLDWNGDDYIDLATVNEDSSDIRMFLSKADATGLFHPFTNPPSATGAVPSPNEAFDLDRDGNADLVTCNVSGNSVSVLRGNGDGTFQPQQVYAMGSGPRGLALLDVDGDGWWDVVTASTGSNSLAIRKNNGDGTLGAATFFEGGGMHEYALTAADMNIDGIYDLVVGNQTSQNIRVHLGLGNGTFAMQPAQSIGGAVWMIVADDLNGDGSIDATTANSFSNNASILLGDGLGGFAAPQVYPNADFSTATDIGDLDGDGDLDWIVSCFSGPEWRMYRNDGTGTFTLHQAFPAPSNPGCATLIDIDGDRDIDTILLDETGDLVIVMENGDLAQRTFCYGDGSGIACPCGNSGFPAHGCEHSQSTGGGLLTALGLASVSSDALSLAAGGLPASTFVAFFQGDAQANGGLGVLAGDGIRCPGGTLIRLAMRPATNGYVVLGASVPTDPLLSVQGAIPAGGGTRYYQAWYRNPAAFCTSDTFNMSNGLEVIWTP